MRALVPVFALGAVWVASCATTENDVGSVPDAGKDASGAKGGSGGSVGGKGGTGGFGGSGGSVFSGGTGGLGASGGFGGTGGSGGKDGGLDGGDGSSGTGFGACVTEQEIQSQSSAPFQIGFCVNPFAGFLCGACFDDGVQPGDVVCSPNCICTPMPAICGSDAGSDVIDEGDAGDAPSDGSTDVSLD